jgi:peptidoglycan biosynthesis protein MviN/MurJ (putative lipid II flippase)
VLAVAAIVTTAVLAGAGPALAGLWEGDRFPHEQIETLVWFLGGLYLLLPVTGVAVILRKVTVSLHRVRETYLALALVQVASALLAWFLVPAFGLAGALVVVALSQAGFCAAPMLVLRAAGSPLQIRFPGGRAWRWLLAAAAGVAAGLIGQRLAGGSLPAIGWGRIADVGLGCMLAAVGVGVAFGLSLMLQVPESRQIAGLLARAFGRRQA